MPVVDSGHSVAPPARDLRVPFFRPDLGDAEIAEVVAVMRSGWLTTGPRVRQFEEAFARAVGARHAVAVSSATAALHLALDAVGLRAGQAVLVPTMTFAATAEVVGRLGAFPVLVDCDPVTLSLDLEDADRKLATLRQGALSDRIPADAPVVGVIPVHVGGYVSSYDALWEFSKRHGLWMVEDAAHAFPAAWRPGGDGPWIRCGEDTAIVTCYSFYANKTITTGEGGMAVTGDAEIAARIRTLSLHGMTRDDPAGAERLGSWEDDIVAPGYKYNLTDIAAAIGIHQLARAEEMRRKRERIAEAYLSGLADVGQLELPYASDHQLHSWHLFTVRLRLESMSIDRRAFVQELEKLGVSCSVHWKPLHLHPYYQTTYNWDPGLFPVATDLWHRLVSLPIFPTMSDDEIAHVVSSVRDVCSRRECAG